MPPPRIYLFIPYYGKFPNYFQLYLDSLKMNQDILTVFFITDIDMTPYSVPENAIIIPLTKADVQRRLAQMLFNVFGKTADPTLLVISNYKFVDFKVAFPVVFHDFIEQYKITNEDYVGFGDCDIIYGKLSNFIKFEENYHILGGWREGHFVAYKNIDSMKYYFKDIPNYFELCIDNSKPFGIDEIACRETLKAFLAQNKYKMFYINDHLCDIVPPRYYHILRQNHASCSKNFFDVVYPHKNIHHGFFDSNKQKLLITYDDGSVREVAYVHLQKRSMALPFQTYNDGFFIYEHEFAAIDS